MPPKDIRAFFGGGGAANASSSAAGGTAKRSAPEEQNTNATQKAKKPKTAASPARAALKRSPAKAAAPAKSPAEGTSAGAQVVAAERDATPPGSGKSKTNKKKKKRADDSDSDFEVLDGAESEHESDAMAMDQDSEEEALPSKRRVSGAARKARAVVIDDSDDEGAPNAAPAKAATSGAKAAKGTVTPATASRALPASLASGGAAKKSSTPGSKTPTAKPAGRKSGAKTPATDDLPQSAKDAMAAVEKAAKALPSSAELLESGKVTKMAAAEGGGGWGGAGGADQEPEHHGQRDHPIGHPDCLTKYTFVFSGVLDSMYRHEADAYVKRHGGRVTTGVSGKTSFLLCGKDTGNSKLTAATEKGTRLLVEEGLLTLVKASLPFVDAQAREVAVAPAPAQAAAAAPITGGAMYSAAGPSSSKAAPTSGRGGLAAAAAPADPGSQLWVDKWKPQSAADLVGNVQSLQTVRQWLSNWHSVHIAGQAPKAAPGARGAKMDMTKKALLLSGPPGIGKTTASQIIARELGYDAVEVNASDARNKSDAKHKDGIGGKLSNRMKELVTNTAIGVDHGTRGVRQVLIMDEVDGMSGGDRGGVSDLIASIKVSKLPIICICNDKYKTSLRSLKNHCLEINWNKPTKLQVSVRLRGIASAEGLTMNQAAMDALVEMSQGDMRVMLGQLQMHRLRASALTFDQVRASAAKDMDKSPFDCARKLLSGESAHWSTMDRMDAVFQDLDLVPLLIQENYLNHQPTLAHNEATAMQVIAKAADAFSAGDIVNRRIRTFQEWHLAPHQAVLSAVYPAAYMRGNRTVMNPGEMNFPRFTAWLGNNSASTKQRRVVGDLTTKLLAAGVVCDRANLRLQYLPTLRAALTQPLAAEGADGIDDVVALMQSYLISRDDFDLIQDVTKFKTRALWGADPMKEVDTKVKSAFTRSFNKQGLPARTTIMVEDVKKGGKKGAAKAAAPVDTEADGMGGEIAEAAAVNAKDEDEDEGVTADDVKGIKGMAFTAAQPSKGRAASAGGRGSRGGAKSARGGSAAGRGGGGAKARSTKARK